MSRAARAWCSWRRSLARHLTKPRTLGIVLVYLPSYQASYQASHTRYSTRCPAHLLTILLSYRLTILASKVLVAPPSHPPCYPPSYSFSRSYCLTVSPFSPSLLGARGAAPPRRRHLTRASRRYGARRTCGAHGGLPVLFRSE